MHDCSREVDLNCLSCCCLPEGSFEVPTVLRRGEKIGSLSLTPMRVGRLAVVFHHVMVGNR